jgi:NADH-quinone oxidoreductase subunit A
VASPKWFRPPLGRNWQSVDGGRERIAPLARTAARDGRLVSAADHGLPAGPRMLDESAHLQPLFLFSQGGKKRCWADWSRSFDPMRLRAGIGGYRQNSLSCALWCAALSLGITPNRRICGPSETAGKDPPMTGILQNYLPLVVFVGVAAVIGLVLLIAPFLVAFQQPDPEKLSAYECGFNAFDDARMKFDVRFYLVAILFIIFDLEVAFLFPWAVAFGKLGATGFWSMVVFLAVLTVGFAYEWKKGALEWD